MKPRQRKSGSGVPPPSSVSNKRRDVDSTLNNTPKDTPSHTGAKEGTWPVVPIGEVVVINPRPSDNKLADDALASFIPMKCMEEESGRFEPLGDRKVADVRKGYTPFRDGDVLFAKVTPCMENGKGAVMKGLTNGIGFGSTEFFALRPADCLDASYLFHFVLQSSFRQQAARNMTGAVGLRRVPKTYLEQQPIPLPPLPEQRRIVAEIEKQFTRLEAGVSALKRVQANLKRYRAAVLKAACEGKLVPTEAELQKSGGRGRQAKAPYETGAALLARILTERREKWQGRGKYKEPAAPDTTKLPPLPEGWAWATLDALAEIKGEITKDQNRKHTTLSRSVPYLRVANVQRGYIDLSEVKEIITTEEEIHELLLKPGDILFNEGGDRDKLGRGWVWNGELPECIHQNHVFRARPNVATLNPKLVSWYANTFGQKFFFDEGKHTTNLASISMSKLKGLPVPIPPPEEQTRIVAEVERRLSVVEELEATVSANLLRATRLRQAVLQRAFTGELV